jgi:hypothetical protein
MTEAQKLTNAERCSLFLLDKEHHELVAKVFDGYPAKGENEVSLIKSYDQVFVIKLGHYSRPFQKLELLKIKALLATLP